MWSSAGTSRNDDLEVDVGVQVGIALHRSVFRHEEGDPTSRVSVRDPAVEDVVLIARRVGQGVEHVFVAASLLQGDQSVLAEVGHRGQALDVPFVEVGAREGQGIPAHDGGLR